MVSRFRVDADGELVLLAREERVAELLARE